MTPSPGRLGAPMDLLVTCEHATRWIPAALVARLGLGPEALQGHRAYDIGAAPLARRLARELGAPLLLGPIGRRLVDLNRSPSNPALWSAESRRLPAADKAAILAAYYTPHRTRVDDAVAEAVARGHRTLHVAVHSFTPRLGGVERTMDLGLLYDPARAWERDVAQRWQRALRAAAPALVVRRNAPYRGVSDGLTRHLRRRYGDRAYAGLELEVNQAWARRGRFAPRVERAILETLRALVEPPQAEPDQRRRRASSRRRKSAMMRR